MGSLLATFLDVEEVHSVELRPGAIIDPGRWLANYDARSRRLFASLNSTPVSSSIKLWFGSSLNLVK